MPYVRYHFYFHPVVVNKAAAPSEESVIICGELCSWDFEVLYQNVRLPHVERGDLIAFLDTGAYAETWADQWMGFPRPAAVLVTQEHVDVIRRREAITDLLSHYRIPPRLLPASPQPTNTESRSGRRGGAPSRNSKTIGEKPS